MPVALSCGPRHGRTVFFSFHPECRDAGTLTVGFSVQVVPVYSGSHPRAAEEAAHVRLTYMRAGTWNAEELRDSPGGVRMGVGGHAGGDGVTRDHAGRYWRTTVVVPNPRRVLDLEKSNRWSSD